MACIISVELCNRNIHIEFGPGYLSFWMTIIHPTLKSLKDGALAIYSGKNDPQETLSNTCKSLMKRTVQVQLPSTHEKPVVQPKQLPRACGVPGSICWLMLSCHSHFFVDCFRFRAACKAPYGSTGQNPVLQRRTSIGWLRRCFTLT